MGKNLEITSRGFRNPWDMAMNDTFDFIGTDNDQNEGDKIFMPFFGAHLAGDTHGATIGPTAITCRLRRTADRFSTAPAPA